MRERRAQTASALSWCRCERAEAVSREASLSLRISAWESLPVKPSPGRSSTVIVSPQNTTAYKNGALNSSPGGGPVGIWTYDADSVVIRNCTSHDNLSLKNDGGGFDLDGGTTNR
jgi:hypothetical protein